MGMLVWTIMAVDYDTGEAVDIRRISWDNPVLSVPPVWGMCDITSGVYHSKHDVMFLHYVQSIEMTSNAMGAVFDIFRYHINGVVQCEDGLYVTLFTMCKDCVSLPKDIYVPHIYGGFAHIRFTDGTNAFLAKAKMHWRE